MARRAATMSDLAAMTCRSGSGICMRASLPALRRHAAAGGQLVLPIFRRLWRLGTARSMPAGRRRRKEAEGGGNRARLETKHKTKPETKQSRAPVGRGLAATVLPRGISGERREGYKGVRSCSFPWWTFHKKKNTQ